MSLYAVSRDRGEALYTQIARQIEQEIGRLYPAGESLPPEAELALRFGVNRHTLRRAVDELVDAGLLERRHGVGVFVLGAPLDYQLGAQTRFTETFAAQGMDSDSQLVRRQIVPADGGVAEHLKIAAGTPVFWLETLRLTDQRPLCVISHFLPVACCPALATDYSGGSLHEFLKHHCGLQLRRVESLVTSVLPQGDDARLLNMPQNRPVLRVKSVNVDDRDDTPVEYAITRFRADRIQLRINP